MKRRLIAGIRGAQQPEEEQAVQAEEQGVAQREPESRPEEKVQSSTARFLAKLSAACKEEADLSGLQQAATEFAIPSGLRVSWKCTLQRGALLGAEPPCQWKKRPGVKKLPNTMSEWV